MVPNSDLKIKQKEIVAVFKVTYRRFPCRNEENHENMFNGDSP
jgi:hypothetical protein